MVMFGDDKQLPSIGQGVSSIPIEGNTEFRPKPEYRPLAQAGQLLFRQFAKDVMNLPVVKRQQSSETRLIEILERTRDDELEDDDVEYLCSFHLSSDNWDPHELMRIKLELLWVFANVEPASQHNIRMLQHVSRTQKNPVAWLRAHSDSSLQFKKAILSHFQQSTSPNVSRICVGAKVSLRGQNFQPNWGLYNGAIGTVKEIRYRKRNGKKLSPNDGDLPDYVVVDFTQYQGPV